MKPPVKPFWVPSKGRKPQDVRKVVPKELIVLSLRDRVSPKDINRSDIECLQELTMAITCLKTYSFNETSCETEIKNMQKCFSDFAAGIQNQKAVGKKLPPKVAKKLLDRYPNI